eukprot:gene9042-1139_t
MKINHPLLVFVLFCLFFNFVSANTKLDQNLLNVYVVPHTHNDVGWLETLRQYYDNCRNHKEKGFEFVLGAWCMNDEATPTYSAIIDQVTLGHQWLLEKFNVTPKYSWQLDPFGYSSVTPSLWSQIGFKNHAIVRVDFELKKMLRKAKQLQFLWQGSKSLVKKTEIFTSIFYNHYNPVNRFKWEPSYPMHLGSGNVPITDKTVKARAEIFSRAMKEWASGYKTNHILYPFGNDFTFMIGTHNFGNMTRLMTHINENSEVYGLNIKYSVLSEYFEIYRQMLIGTLEKLMISIHKLTEKTGYFSSYPELKDITRQANNWEEHLPLRESNAILQHHDGVTGTAKDFVRKDYFDRMHSGIDKAIKSMEKSLNDIIKSENEKDVKIKHTYKTIDLSSDQNLIIYNSLSWTRTEILKIYSKYPVSNIKGPNDEDVLFDIIYYVPHDGDDGRQKSGVYIFRPKKDKPIRIDTHPKTVVFEGNHVIVVSQTFSNYIEQNYTLIKRNNELNVDVRPSILPRNHEITFKLSTNIQNKEMYTDDNGLEVKKRKNEQKQFTIISNRTLGVGYLKEGEFEIMFHRRTDYDDGRGVAEELNDYSTSNLGMKIIFDRKEVSQALRHRLSYELNFPLETFLLDNSKKIKNVYVPVACKKKFF